MFMEFDANFDGITLFDIPVLHFCDAAKKHTVVYFTVTQHTLNGLSCT